MIQNLILNASVLPLPDISLDFTDISGFNLTETVVMNRKSELKGTDI